MEMEKRLEEETEDNLLADNFEMSFRYLYIRHGTGEKATYTLQPAWRVQIDQKNNEETLLFYDAITGKQLFWKQQGLSKLRAEDETAVCRFEALPLRNELDQKSARYRRDTAGRI